VDNWQGKLAEQTVMPILQDEYWTDAWERFGGGEGDIFVYDAQGRLFAVFCSQGHSEYMECTDIYPDSVEGLNAVSYKTLKSVAAKAADASATRCDNFDDYYYGGYATYYNDDDDDSNGDDDDDDDSHAPAGTTTIANPNPNPHDDDDTDDDTADDDYYYYYYYYDDDAPNNRFNLGFHNNHEEVSITACFAA
jgi:hypothetical protein